MPLSVSHRVPPSLNQSPYSSDLKWGENILNTLISAVVAESPLHCRNDEGGTIKEHLDTVYHHATNNCYESIELLQNLAMGKGEVAMLAQEYLCRIVCQDEGIATEVAQKARAMCQSLLIDFPQWVNDDYLQDRFKLLFVAGAHIKEEGLNLDNIPALVKEKITQVDSLPVKPKWYTPQEGRFNAIDYATFSEDDRQLRYSLPEDGACQFRAALMLRDQSERWLNVDKKYILREIKNNGWESKIQTAIKNAVERMGEIYQYYPVTQGETVEKLIYNDTIANGAFTLYSPHAIRDALPKELRKINQAKNGNDTLSEMTPEQWENFSNIISEHLIIQLGINVHNGMVPYAECNIEQAHYSVIVAADERFTYI